MFKTPVNEKRRRSLVSESSAKKTPIATSSMVEPSVLNTPEEPGNLAFQVTLLKQTKIVIIFCQNKLFRAEGVQKFNLPFR